MGPAKTWPTSTPSSHGRAQREPGDPSRARGTGDTAWVPRIGLAADRGMTIGGTGPVSLRKAVNPAGRAGAPGWRGRGSLPPRRALELSRDGAARPIPAHFGRDGGLGRRTVLTSARRSLRASGRGRRSPRRGGG